MRRLPRFEIHRPATVVEASRLLRELGDEARAYAGGTELLLAMKLSALRYAHLVDLKTVPGLADIVALPDRLRIGALATHREVERSAAVRAHAPVLATAAARIANQRVRAMGTVGGNLCFAEPHSDLATLLLCLEARCLISRGGEPRSVGVETLVAGPYQMSLEPDEILLAVEVPVLGPAWSLAYGKFQLHERPTLGVGVALHLSEDRSAVREARVAIGCVCPTSRRSASVERLLVGSLDDVRRALPHAAEVLAADAELVDDEEGSADYKTHLIGVFLRRQVERSLTGERLAA